MTNTLAQKLRSNPTQAEKAMWRLLFPFRTGGFHFRKQVALGPYVADFACHHAKIVIEVDGDSHATEQGPERDRARDDYLIGRGFKVVRFSNADVLENPEGVFAVIEDILNNAATPSPTLPARGRVSRGAGGKL